MGVIVLIAWIACGLSAFFSGTDPVMEFDKEEGSYLGKALMFVFCLIFYVAFGPFMLFFKWLGKQE